MKKLAILGASGHGKVVAETALLCGWQEIVFFDDAYPNKKKNGHWSICGNSEALQNQLPSFDGVVIAIGDNQIRLDKTKLLKRSGAILATIVHPSACVSGYAHIGTGTVIFANVVVNVDAYIGEAVILNTACSVDHDCNIGDAAHISPGVHLAGAVLVGACSWLGIGACVRQCIEIGENSVVGAGSTVVSHVMDNEIVVGNPAKVMEKKC